MKEDQVREKLVESLDEALAGHLKSSPRLLELEIGDKNVKSFMCLLAPRDSNPIAAIFTFEKHFLDGYMPGGYMVASWSDYSIRSTIAVTSYPRAAFSPQSFLGMRKYVFLPVYSKNLREFHSDNFYKEKIGWYPLVEKLCGDDDLNSWFHKMPTKTESHRRKIEYQFGGPRNLSSCVGQLVPVATQDQRDITAVGFRCIPRWKLSMLGGGVNGLDLSYLSYLVMILRRINEHLRRFDFREKAGETPLPNRFLLQLTSEAMKIKP